MKYTQKDICRLLNITRETLRFYEKKGIICPEINPDNLYRFYDDYQFYLIAECKRHQANGFSIDEISQMLKEDNLERFTDRIARRQEEMVIEIERLRKANELLTIWLDHLSSIHTKLGRFEPGWQGDVFFVPQREGASLKLDEDSVGASRCVMGNLKVTFMMAYWPDITKQTYEWGFGIYRWMAEPDTVDLLEGMDVRIGKAITGIIDAGSAWDLDRSVLDAVVKAAAERSLKPAGSCVCINLARVREEDGIHRYFEVYLPVQW